MDKRILENRFSSGLQNIFGFLRTGTNSYLNWTLGVDVSKWQGYINWDTMYSKNVRFGVTKATDIGSVSHQGFVDETAIRNYKDMKESGILTGAYCWLDPIYFDGEYQAKYYLDNFYSLYPTDLPPVVDFEDPAFSNANDFLWKLQRWLETVEMETGRMPIVYTSPGFMGYFRKDKSGFLARYPLWDAHYIQRTYPTIPYPWTKWHIWQYSHKGHYPYFIWNDPGTGNGQEFGATSSGLDMNWFQGTYFDLLAFCEAEEPTPPIPPDPEKPLYRAKCVASSLYVRSGPSTSFPTTYYEGKVYLEKDQVVSVYEEEAGWLRIGERQWVSGYYMSKIETPTDNVLFQAKCIVNALNVRGGPAITYNKKRVLLKGQIVNVYKIVNNWYKISEYKEEWCSGYPQYMKKL